MSNHELHDATTFCDFVPKGFLWNNRVFGKKGLFYLYPNIFSML
jgi:hypothetical protein